MRSKCVCFAIPLMIMTNQSLRELALYELSTLQDTTPDNLNNLVNFQKRQLIYHHITRFQGYIYLILLTYIVFIMIKIDFNRDNLTYCLYTKLLPCSANYQKPTTESWRNSRANVNKCLPFMYIKQQPYQKKIHSR
jgi:hypothetical protein